MTSAKINYDEESLSSEYCYEDIATSSNLRVPSNANNVGNPSTLNETENNHAKAKTSFHQDSSEDFQIEHMFNNALANLANFMTSKDSLPFKDTTKKKDYFDDALQYIMNEDIKSTKRSAELNPLKNPEVVSIYDDAVWSLGSTEPGPAVLKNNVNLKHEKVVSEQKKCKDTSEEITQDKFEDSVTTLEEDRFEDSVTQLDRDRFEDSLTNFAKVSFDDSVTKLDKNRFEDSAMKFDQDSIGNSLTKLDRDRFEDSVTKLDRDRFEDSLTNFAKDIFDDSVTELDKDRFEDSITKLDRDRFEDSLTTLDKNKFQDSVTKLDRDRYEESEKKLVEQNMAKSERKSLEKVQSGTLVEAKSEQPAKNKFERRRNTVVETTRSEKFSNKPVRTKSESESNISKPMNTKFKLLQEIKSLSFSGALAETNNVQIADPQIETKSQQLLQDDPGAKKTKQLQNVSIEIVIEHVDETPVEKVEVIENSQVETKTQEFENTPVATNSEQLQNTSEEKTSGRLKGKHIKNNSEHFNATTNPQQHEDTSIETTPKMRH